MKRSNPRLNARLFLYAVLCFGAGLLLFQWPRGMSKAAPVFSSIVVNSLADNTTAGNHLCTLREAIKNANNNRDTTNGDCAAGAGADVITFSVTGTINLTAALSPADNTTITGPGAAGLTVKRNTGGNYSVFNIDSDTVTISGLTISNGNGSFSGGGAITAGDTATVNLNNCVLSTNTAQLGGAVFNSGTVNISGSTFSSNTANSGGAINNFHGTMTITNSTFTANSTTTSTGGHIATNGGTTTISGCTLSGATKGGGILNTGVMTITNSTISNNKNTAFSGGGIQNDTNGFDSVGSLTISNSTIGPGNNSGAGGGGLANLNGSTINAVNCTISGNIVSNGAFVGGVLTVNSDTTFTNVTVTNNPGGITNEGTGTFTLRNSIVSGNTVSDISGDNIAANSSFNLVGPVSTGFEDGVNHNQVGANPLLGPLQNNGGPTLTQALGAGSAAIDRGSSAFVINPPFLGPPFTDQRGTAFARIAEGNADCTTSVDLGAFEVQNNVAIPNPPDLQNESDNGASQTDNLTNDNTPTFDISGVTAGATVQLLRNCVVVASGTAAGASITLTDPGASAGTKSYSANQIVAGVTSGAPAALSVVIDTTAPTVPSINRVNANPTNAASVQFTVTFKEAVTGVDSADFTLATAGVTGTSLSVAGSGATYVVTVNTGLGSGTVRLDVTDNDSIADLAGNPLGGTGVGNGNFVTGQTYTIDKTGPVVTINQGAAQSDPTNTAPINFTVVFGESISDFADGDITLSGSAGATTAIVTGSGTTYNVAVSGMTGSGTVIASIGAGVAHDALGNPNDAATATDNTITYDVTPPTVQSITRANPSPTSAATVDFTVNFSKPVTSVDPTDFVITTSGSITGSSVTAVSGSGATYIVTAGNYIGSGTLRLDLVDNDSIIDSGNLWLGGTGAGNGNFAAGEAYRINGADITTAFEVNTTEDSDDNQCTPLGPGGADCTLREAINAANADPGMDTITFDVTVFAPAGGPYTINLGSALNDLTSMAIQGPGANVLTVRRDTGGAYRIFMINQDQSVDISNLTVSNGVLSGASFPLDAGGGILNLGNLNLTNCSISGNSAGSAGGGILNLGAATLANSTISGNSNQFIGGGGIYNSGTSMTVTSCTISGNSTSSGLGAGIYNGSTLNLTNSTISGNGADQGSGGGIYNAGAATLTGATITANRADKGNFSIGTGGGIFNNTGTPLLRNTIVAGNFAGSGTTADDIAGSTLLDSTGSYNLIGTGGSGGLTNLTNNNQVGIANPGLAPLGWNGGATQTHRLFAGSPALDKGDDCSTPATDQRGQARPINDPAITDAGDGSDIGAYELQAATSAPNAPDLQAASDSGASQSDNLTKNTSLTFDIGGLTEGVFVELLRDGNVVAAGAAAGINITLTDPNVPANATHTYSAREAAPGEVTSAESASLSVEIDTTAPGITISAPSLAIANGSSNVTYTVTYSDSNLNDVSLGAGDIMLNTSGANATIMVSGNGNTRLVTLSSINGNGTLGISIAAGTALDTAGNSAHDVGPSNTFTVDTAAPSATINQAKGQPDPVTNALAISFTVIFSEPVTGLAAAGVDLSSSTTSGALAAGVNEIGPLNGTSYNVEVSGMNSNGVVVAKIRADAAQDVAGNLSEAATSVDNQVTYRQDSYSSFVVNSAANTDDGACDPLGSGSGNHDCTLREAINAANADFGTENIIFDPVLTAGGAVTIALSMPLGALPDIRDDLTITGPTNKGLTLSGENRGRVFTIAAQKKVTIANLTIELGQADFGGGILSLGDLTIINSTLTANKAVGGSGQGGAVASEGGSLVILNSTISGNTAEASGGGLVNSGTSRAVLTNVTITNNRAGADGVNVLTGSGGGIAQISSNSLTFNNTIVAGNFNDAAPAMAADDILAFTGSGPVSAASSLVGDAKTSGGVSDGANGNHVGNGGSGTIDINTVLKTALTDNGGSTRTHLPTPGSVVINAGDKALARDQNNNPLTTDQRGFARALDTVDMGAVEAAYTISVMAGTPQTAYTNTAFGTQLQAVVAESGAPQSGLSVTFTAPAGGASGAFSGNVTTATATTNSNGVATAPMFTANNIAGSYQVTASTGADSTTASFNLTNKERPVANDQSVGTNEDTAAAITLIGSDPDGVSLSFTVTGSPAHGTLSGTAPNLTYTPAAEYNGSDSFTFKVNNGQIDSATNGAISIEVAAVNDSPTLDQISDPAAIPEDGGQQTISLGGISAGPGDESKQALTVTASSSNTALIPNPTVMYTSPNNTGTLVYAPVPNQAGSALITVTVKDDGGTGNGAVDHITRTFTVNVTLTTTYAEAAGNCGSGNNPCYTTIQAAMEALTSGGKVNVIGGTFNEDLNLGNNVTVNLEGNTTINSFTISAGTLNGGSGGNGGNITLTVANGNWTNNGGTFNPGGGTVNFAGAGQTIGGTNQTTFNNLTISAGGSTVNSALKNEATLEIPSTRQTDEISVDATVGGLLTLAGDLTVISPARLIMPAGAASAGTADVIGNVLRTGFVSAVCTKAPCGNTLSFGNPDNQITITDGLAPSSIMVNLVKSAPANYTSAVQRNYTISENDGSGFTATLRLHYFDSELNGNNEAGLNLRRFSGSWQSATPSIVDTTNNWVESSAVTGFSPWTFASLAPTVASGLINGRITTDEGPPVAGVVVRLSGSVVRKTITDANGNYRFSGVEPGGFYSVSPARVDYRFNPFNRSFSQLSNQTEADFGGSFTGETANPLDTPEYFVRQQYVDVLGREPDEGGFNFWSDRILICGDNEDCIRSQRIAVAAEFFFNQEFQQSGTFIYSLFQSSFGRRPSFAEYSSARQQVVGGADLETEQQAFTESLVQSGEFLQKYQPSASGAAFVESILLNLRQTSGVELGNRRDGLIARYNTGSSQAQSRALVLREVTESTAVRNANYNAAFVLTQYFAYLRRSADRSGYEFWLNTLDFPAATDPNNYSRLICSFITAREYQLRFSSVVKHSNAECGPY